MTDPRTRPDDSQRPWFRRVPWFVWVLFAVALVLALVFALTARGQAVDDVSLGGTTQVVAAQLRGVALR
jgi:hypothetical protein